MKTRKEIKIEDARKEYQQLITSGWQVTELKWQCWLAINWTKFYQAIKIIAFGIIEIAEK